LEAIKRKVRAGIKKLLPGHFPDFIIAGAQKCATTSLHYYLAQHPGLMGSRPKEVHFFDVEETYAKGLTWYSHNFPNTKPLNGSLLYFESSPSYLYEERVPARIHELNPSIKLILILRDPVQRAFSAWNMYYGFLQKGYVKKFIIDPFPPGRDNPLLKYFYSNGTSFPSLKETLELERRLMKEGGPSEPAVFRRGLYAGQIRNYLKYFKREQLLILGFKDLTTNLEGTLETVYRFLGVPSFSYSKLNIESRNIGTYYAKLSEQEKELLSVFYKESNEELFEMLGTRINW
jgi:Sulfotransferase domain